MNKFIRIRSRINLEYIKELSNIPDIRFQQIDNSVSPVCWLFSCLIQPRGKFNRDSLIKYLRAHRIDSRPFFFPLTSFLMYKTKQKFPISEQVSKQGINLPTYVDLEFSQIKYIAKSIKKFYRESSK